MLLQATQCFSIVKTVQNIPSVIGIHILKGNKTKFLKISMKVCCPVFVMDC